MAIWTVSGSFRGLPILLSANSAHGGAISSLTWNGKQFLNSFDNGRLLQTAMQYDGQGEFQNPTEGGSAYDTPGNTSSLILYEAAVTPNVLVGVTQMAYWFPYLGQTLSGTVVGKTTTVGWGGIDNLIGEHINIGHGTIHAGYTMVEVRTAYLPPEFQTLRSLDVSSASYSNLVWNQTGTEVWTNHAAKDAIVAATPDGLYAIGLWSPNSSGHFVSSYLSDAHPTIKIDAVAFEPSVSAGQYFGYDSFIAIGSVSEVAATLHQAWLEWGCA